MSSFMSLDLRISRVIDQTPFLSSKVYMRTLKFEPYPNIKRGHLLVVANLPVHFQDPGPKCNPVIEGIIIMVTLFTQKSTLWCSQQEKYHFVWQFRGHNSGVRGAILPISELLHEIVPITMVTRLVKIDKQEFRHGSGVAPAAP